MSELIFSWLLLFTLYCFSLCLSLRESILDSYWFFIAYSFVLKSAYITFLICVNSPYILTFSKVISYRSFCRVVNSWEFIDSTFELKASDYYFIISILLSNYLLIPSLLSRSLYFFWLLNYNFDISSYNYFNWLSFCFCMFSNCSYQILIYVYIF